MRNIIAKIVATGVLVLAVAMSTAGAQSYYQQRKPSPAQQPYRYQQQPNTNTAQQQSQNQQQTSSGIPRQRSYDPNAGLHNNQNGRSIREQINPCNRNYGIVMDGWHDAGLLMTVKSLEWWLAVVFLAGLLVVGFDDLFHIWRLQDMREAIAGVALLMLNDRAYCLRRANDAIFRYNNLILKGDAVAKEVAERSQAATHRTISPIQVAESSTVLEDESPVPSRVPTSQDASVGALSESGNKIQDAQADVDGEEDDAKHINSGDAAAEETGRMVTLDLGGKKLRIPLQVHLHINSLNRKVENQRITINGLEERLSQYEKD